jgi:hypothetical protein
MTNMTTASVNAGWEVAGGKKNANVIKKVGNEPAAAKGKAAKEAALKMPKIDTLRKSIKKRVGEGALVAVLKCFTDHVPFHFKSLSSWMPACMTPCVKVTMTTLIWTI